MSPAVVLSGSLSIILLVVGLMLCRCAYDLGQMRLRYLGEKARADDLVDVANRQATEIWNQRGAIVEQGATIRRLQAELLVPSHG